MNYFFSFKKTIDGFLKRTEAYNMHKWKGEKYLARKHTVREHDVLLSGGKLWRGKIADCKMQSSKEVNY